MLEQSVIDKQDLKDKVKGLKSMAMKMSLDYADNLINKVADNDQLKQLNEIKKHIKFAEKLYQELFGKEGAPQVKPIGIDLIADIKKLQSSLGDIVRKIPT